MLIEIFLDQRPFFSDGPRSHAAHVVTLAQPRYTRGYVFVDASASARLHATDLCTYFCVLVKYIISIIKLLPSSSRRLGFQPNSSVPFSSHPASSAYLLGTVSCHYIHAYHTPGGLYPFPGSCGEDEVLRQILS